MTGKRIAAILVVAAFVPTVAFSECKDQQGTVESLYKNCFKPRLDESNKKLNQEVQAVAERLSSHGRTKGTIAAAWFKDSQAAWERYRYLFCEVRSISEVGPQSSRGLSGIECVIDLNEKRLTELRELQKYLSP